MTTALKSAGIASAAALFALSTLASAAPAPAGSSGKALGTDDTIHCYGVNSCKGSADCKTSAHEYRGHNECKAQGFKAMKPGACLSKGGTIGDLG
jgi:uncharacterized membrane protein